MSAATPARDPVTGLTQTQVDSFTRILGNLTAAESRERLKEDLQTAILIELSTIPIYLYTYYSIARKPPEAPWTDVSDVQVYAGKAGALVMSVAVEEMLHMSLSSNIYFSLFNEPPELYMKSPAYYPAQLPYHNPIGPPGPDGSPQVAIPLAKLSFEQLWHFLQIEYPMKPDELPVDRDWNSLSQFYDYIKFLMSKLSDSDFQTGSTEYQIQPYNYSVNNVDTLYVNKAFDPWLYPSSAPDKDGYLSAAQAAQYSNAHDSHRGTAELITVASKQQAFDAIGTISDQGEGAQATEWDDQSDLELSRFYKFMTLQAQIDEYKDNKEVLPTPAGGWPPGLEPLPPLTPTITTAQLSEPYQPTGGGVVYNFPDDPLTRPDPNRPSTLPPPYIYSENKQASDYLAL
ncbi:MAG TPA: ferritin-like domain-containing protein, partial [Nitrospiraceae bacterium]|nr:ferritin-like domain-containing protein [Nitrospiraceae bacterium]